MSVPDASLNVIALVSGGKDSFYSLLHCLAQGHRIVALANLYPPPPPPPLPAPASGHDAAAQHGARGGSPAANAQEPPESDLNSFMYQTVGHQTIPLYAQATGLPLFRHPIHGTALHHGLSYHPGGHHLPSAIGTDSDAQAEDETESLVPLLQAVVKAHPEANAVSTGAILSTYQRTRVESVAIRLGLVPLGYLWQYPDLPRAVPFRPSAEDQSISNGTPTDDAQLLRDMAHTGLEARIIKVASAGLDERILWENAASDVGISRVQRGLRKFGGGGKGAVLGEGGEFETLVTDGPPELFKGRIVVREDDRQVISEGGGSEWLLIRKAAVEMKASPAHELLPQSERSIPIPALLDGRFEAVLQAATQPSSATGATTGHKASSPIKLSSKASGVHRPDNRQACFVGEAGANNTDNVQQQTERLIQTIQSFLSQSSLVPTDILNSIIVLRHMADFPAINKFYGSLFTEANPPSRVTISCGDLLPPGSLIAIYLVMQARPRPYHRKGLHVQSRSYWAPANIGPYSQAISYPMISLQSRDVPTDSDRAVSIAGQIPLVPATMNFLPSKPHPDADQITLALQHLWRVGIAMNVQYWTSAVAYFPTMKGCKEDMYKNSLAVSRAWKQAHLWSDRNGNGDGDDGDDAGPDLWDRRYNSQYQSFTSAAEESGGVHGSLQLPRWTVIEGLDEQDSISAQEELLEPFIPFVFAAEVEELPRSASVEWHAHIGLAKIQEGSVQVHSSRAAVGDDYSTLLPIDLHQVAVSTPHGTYLHTTAVLSRKGHGVARVEQGAELAEILGHIGSAVSASVAGILDQNNNDTTGCNPSTGETPTPSPASASAYLVYTDAQVYPFPARTGASTPALIPCRSLWDGQGQELAIVALFETVFSSSGGGGGGGAAADSAS